MYAEELEAAVEAVRTASALCVDVRQAFAADGMLDKADKSPEDEVRHVLKRHSAVAISALDRKTLSPLLDELEARLWEG